MRASRRYGSSVTDSPVMGGDVAGLAGRPRFGTPRKLTNGNLHGHWAYGLRRASVRARTTAFAALIVGAALVAAAFGLLATLEHSLTSNRDDLSRARATDLVTQAEHGTLPSVLTDIGEDSVGQVVGANGTVVAASSGLSGQGAISSTAGATGPPTLRILRDVPDDSEVESYRVWVARGTSPSGQVTVFVGASLESVDEAVASLRRALLLGVPVMLVVLAFGTRLLVGRALRPVEDMRAEVALITDTAQNRRIPMPPAADEIGRLAGTMNDMLDRLDAASTRQREFIADASHELQSPLAAFRVQLEVALAHHGEVEWLVLARDLLADSDRMERLVRDLLFLAQVDAIGYAPLAEPVDLDLVVLEEVSRLRARVAMDVDATRVSAAPVKGHREDLARLVRNLLDNAATYASSRVRVTLSSDSRCVRLAICDDGPGIPPEQRSRVFDRFARVEGARARSSGGTGLGLSIVREIAKRHSGSVTVGAAPTADTSGACLEVELPLSPVPTARASTPLGR